MSWNNWVFLALYEFLKFKKLLSKNSDFKIKYLYNTHNRINKMVTLFTGKHNISIHTYVQTQIKSNINIP